jgi:hypothetical protein
MTLQLLQGRITPSESSGPFFLLSRAARLPSPALGHYWLGLAGQRRLSEMRGSCFPAGKQ